MNTTDTPLAERSLTRKASVDAVLSAVYGRRSQVRILTGAFGNRAQLSPSEGARPEDGVDATELAEVLAGEAVNVPDMPAACPRSLTSTSSA